MANNTEKKQAEKEAKPGESEIRRRHHAPRGGSMAAPDRIGLVDFAVAALLGLGAYFAMSRWSFPGVMPRAWNDLAVASGLRPAVHVAGNYFTLLACALVRGFGLDPAVGVLRTAGHVMLAATGSVVYLILRELLMFLTRMRPQQSHRRRFITMLAAAAGTTAFVCSDPVWSSGQFLGETGILLLATVVSIDAFLVFLRKGMLRHAYVCVAALGVVAAESPIGIGVLALFIAVQFMVLKLAPSSDSPFFRPETIAVGKWYITFVFVAFVALGIAANFTACIVSGGTSAGIGSLPLAYIGEYWSGVPAPMSALAKGLVLGMCAIPLFISLVKFPSAADEESFLRYSTGMAFAVCGTVAFSQCSAISALWFWRYCPVENDFALAAGLILNAATLALALAIFGVDAMCRNHRRLAVQRFGRMSGERGASGDIAGGATLWIRRLSIVVTAALLVFGMAVGREKLATREMLSVLDAAVAETVTEAGEAKYIFTDGTLDAAIELEAHRRGRDICCISLAPGPSSLRTRALGGDAEDLAAFAEDGGTGLRLWLTSKRSRLDDCAVQAGIEFWAERFGLKLPPVGGFVAKPSGFGKGVAERGIAAARSLASRIQKINDKGYADKCGEAAIRAAFFAVQWRLARMCHWRGVAADAAGDAATAAAEEESARRLNATNAVYADMLAAIRRQIARSERSLTPREGLLLALAHADFPTAQYYARFVIAADPEHADANFALGMFERDGGRLAEAEEHLKRCLVRKPNEPAVYNNLAMVQLELGKLDAAETNAARAVALMPDALVFQSTKRAIEEARAKK